MNRLRPVSLVLCLLLPACGQGTPPEDGAAPTAGNPGTSSSGPPAGDASPAFDGRLIEVSVAGRTVTPRLGSVDVALGEKVLIEVTADVQDELHVHGYDRRVDLAPGEAGAVEFEANIPGSFQVELEKAHLKLFDLRVR